MTFCFVRHFHGGAKASSIIWCVAAFNGASAAPCVLVAWSFLYILLILGSSRFDKSARICTLFSPTPLTTHLENLSYASLSSGNTPLT